MKSNKYTLLNKEPRDKIIFDQDIELENRSTRFSDIPYSKFQQQTQNNEKQIKKGIGSGKIIKNTKKQNQQYKQVNQSSLYINQQVDHNPFGKNGSKNSTFTNSKIYNNNNLQYPSIQENNPYKSINTNQIKNSTITNIISQSKAPYQSYNQSNQIYSQIPLNNSNYHQYYQYPYNHSQYNYYQSDPYNSQRYQQMNTINRSQINNILPPNLGNSSASLKDKQQNIIKTSSVSSTSKRSEENIILNNTQVKNSSLNKSIIRSAFNGAEIDIQNPYVPPVIAQCQACGQKQHVPGDQAQFYCYKCKKVNFVEPKFGLFICGNCRGKVSYPYTLSDHIQCNICYTINKVPIVVQSTQKLNKSKIVRLSEDNDETESILPKQLKELTEQNLNETMKWNNSENQIQK